MELPSSVVLEVSALCNISCKGCALHGPQGFVTRPFGNMKKSVWAPVIKEMGSWHRKVAVVAHGGGEPLLNPEFKDLIGLAKTFPNLNIGFLTNGMRLDEAWVDFIMDVGLDWIAFSLDGVDPKTHDAIRKKSSLVKVEANLHRLLAARSKAGTELPKIKLNMVAYDEIKDQADDFVDKWVRKVDGVMVSHYRNPPQSKRWPNVPLERKPCKLLWNQAIVAWDGRLGLCCEDFNIDHSPGCIGNGTSLAEIWRGALFERVRALHRQSLYEDHPLCRDCDSWAEDYARKNQTHPKGYNMVVSPSQTEFFAERPENKGDSF